MYEYYLYIFLFTYEADEEDGFVSRPLVFSSIW